MRVTTAVLVAGLFVVCGCEKVERFFGGDLSPQEQGRQHLEKAVAAEKAGDDSTALREYEAARTTLLNDSAISAGLGRLYAKRGDDAQAVMSLKRAVELDGSNAELRKLLADVYLRQGHPKLAAATLSEVGATSDDLDAQVKLIRTLILTHKPEDALQTSQKLIDAHPDSAAALSVRAEALLANGDPDQAAKLLDQAVAKAPEDVDVRLARARFLSRRGMHQVALSELQRGDAAQSERSDVIFARAHELALLHQYDEAGKVLDGFTASHPNDPEAQSTLAWVKLQAGDTDAARAAAEAVLSKRPTDAQALYVRARCLESLDEDARAIGAYRSVLAAAPGDTEALERLWQLYEKEGQVTDAIAALETLYDTHDASDAEMLELARLYSETGFDAARGLKIVEQLAHSDVPKPGELAGIRTKLQQHAHARGGSHGPVIIRGGH